MLSKKGFTLVELMVVILIVAILASVAIPIMRGRIDDAKWSEAASSAGSIRTAVRAKFAESPATVAEYAGATLDDQTVRRSLGFGDGDLEGTYFTAASYEITSIDATNGNAVITVTGGGNAPEGTATLDDSGWTVSESSN